MTASPGLAPRGRPGDVIRFLCLRVRPRSGDLRLPRSCHRRHSTAPGRGPSIRTLGTGVQLVTTTVAGMLSAPHPVDHRAHQYERSALGDVAGSREGGSTPSSSCGHDLGIGGGVSGMLGSSSGSGCRSGSSPACAGSGSGSRVGPVGSSGFVVMAPMYPVHRLSAQRCHRHVRMRGSPRGASTRRTVD